MTFETFDQTCWWQFLMTISMTTFDDNFWWQFLMTIFLDLFQLVTCDIWDTDYNTDNWEPGFMTIFVTWQLIVTLDNICNSCDVLCVVPDTHLDTDMQLVVSDSLQICLLWFNQLPVIRNAILVHRVQIYIKSSGFVLKLMFGSTVRT